VIEIELYRKCINHIVIEKEFLRTRLVHIIRTNLWLRVFVKYWWWPRPQLPPSRYHANSSSHSYYKLPHRVTLVCSRHYLNVLKPENFGRKYNGWQSCTLIFIKNDKLVDHRIYSFESQNTSEMDEARRQGWAYVYAQPFLLGTILDLKI